MIFFVLTTIILIATVAWVSFLYWQQKKMYDLTMRKLQKSFEIETPHDALPPKPQAKRVHPLQKFIADRQDDRKFCKDIARRL